MANQYSSITEAGISIVVRKIRIGTSVSVVSDKSWTGAFFSTSSIAISTSHVVHQVEFRGSDKAHHAHNLILWYVLR